MPPPRTLLRALPGPAGAPGSFVLPLRKLVLSYCPADAASAGMRAWVAREAEAFARARRSVEVVVQEVPHKQPLAKGFYRECGVSSGVDSGQRVVSSGQPGAGSEKQATSRGWAEEHTWRWPETGLALAGKTVRLLAGASW
jgi:hypothetical protein